MAAGGPSQRKTSISTLVYSTLGPSLGLLPSEDRKEKEKDWVFVEENGAAETGSADSAISRPQPASASSTISGSDMLSEATNTDKDSDKSKPKAGGANTGEVLCRLYSSPASSSPSSSSLGKKNRLAFTSKSGAGSISSMEQATLPEKSSGVEGALSPMSPVTKQLQGQISGAGEQTPR